MESYYFDSGVFITPFLKNIDERIINKCLTWQKKIMDGSINAYTSYLTWDEITYIIRKNKGKEEASLIGEKILTLPNLNFIDVDNSIIEDAQKFFEKFNVKPRDLIHAVSSLKRANGNIITLDIIDFKKIKDDNGNQLLNIIEIK